MTYDPRREARRSDRTNRRLIPLLSEYYFANEAPSGRCKTARVQKARDSIELFLGMRRKEPGHGR